MGRAVEVSQQEQWLVAQPSVGSPTRPRGALPARLPLIAAALLAPLIAWLAATVPVLAVGLVAGVAYAWLAFVSRTTALALLIAASLCEGVPAVNLAVKVGALVVTASWFVDLFAAGERERPRLLTTPTDYLMLAFLAWITLSLLWAVDVSAAAGDLWRWWSLALLFFICKDEVARRGAGTTLLAALYWGAVASVLIGALLPGIVPILDRGAFVEGRLRGGIGDPNFTAAFTLMGLALAGVLIARQRNPVLKLCYALGVPILAFGLVATQSRGGLIGAAVVAVVAFLVLKEQRARLLTVVALCLSVMALYLVSVPSGWERLTRTDDGGNGRSSLWTVAWRVAEDHPLLGVGLNNFPAVAADYTRAPGQLTFVNLIVDSPHFVHNTYLQVLTELGVVGFALFIAFVGSALLRLRRRLIAARAQRDRRAVADLSAVSIALVGLLATFTFVSGALDKRLWVLLALATVLPVSADDKVGERRD